MRVVLRAILANLLLVGVIFIAAALTGSLNGGLALLLIALLSLAAAAAIAWGMIKVAVRPFKDIARSARA
ncbi:MAG TPA: hypothetical protein VNL15_09050, partial [Dehalococcoidia bacterium]|nr:hypothetical protein [Dehalococcoidia bacterium]